ncbi:MAG: tetratricopeptide repeat protein [Nitrososphaerales archaeon]
MAQTVQRGQVTPADELRDLLETDEKRVANVRGSGEGAVQLLKELDRIAELWPQLEAQGVDLRPEAGRWETLQASVERNAPGILAELQRCGGIRTIRKEVHPAGTDAAWWHLDEYVAQARSKRVRRTLSIGLGVVVLVAAAWFLLQKLFPVDPKVAESVRRVSRGEQLVQQNNDWAGAIAEFQAAAALTPGDYDVWLRLGVAEEQLGNQQAAQDAYAKARDLLPSEGDFLKGRASAYLLFNLFDQAGKDIQAALAIKNDDAQAWYQAASVYESRGQISEAIDALQKAGAYAEKTGQDELTALSRYRMGMLMQRMNVPQGTPSATP